MHSFPGRRAFATVASPLYVFNDTTTSKLGRGGTRHMMSLRASLVVSSFVLTAALGSNASAQEALAADAVSAAFSLRTVPIAEPLDPKPSPLFCACGCGVFEVGGVSMLPQGEGGIAWLEWDYADQNRNWHGTSSAPAADNPDKKLRTNFFQVGVQYMLDTSWGLQVQAPFAERYFRSLDDNGNSTSTDWVALGDARIKGLYTGFRDDFSLGVDFGLKLPTGNYKHSGADRDTQVGSGSTDLLLGGFYRMPLSSTWRAFYQVEGDVPALIADHYRPGIELNGSAGIEYTTLSAGSLSIVPVAQVILSTRTSDSGANSADPVASGYQRAILSPGVELSMHSFMLYADVEFPVWQNMRGNQLVAPALFKVMVGFTF